MRLPETLADLDLPANPDDWTDEQLLEAARTNAELPWRGLAYAVDVVYATLMGWKQLETKHPSGSARLLLRLLATRPERSWFPELRARVREGRTMRARRGRPAGSRNVAAA